MTNIYVNFMIIGLVVLLTTYGGASANRMAYNHPGETKPVTVEEAIGADFNVTCYMNPKAFPGKNSSCLFFVNGRTNDELPSENIVITNRSSIVYMVRNASEQQTEYRCKCGTDAIMETKVFVGTLPKPGENFTCRSYDFEYMICNFSRPPNPILTTYNVSYHYGMPNYIFQPRCNYDDRILVVCNTSLKVRSQQEYYYFKIESSNALVMRNEPPLSQHFVINNYEVMIPSKPGFNVREESVSVDGIRLAWQMHNWEKYRAKGLQWEVVVQPENATALRGHPPDRDHNELRLRIVNLPYAYWQYELKVRVRVKHPSAVWSEPWVYRFRTTARRPARPPLMQPGSFYIDSMETLVTLYWEELQPYEYNGDNFTYVIRSVRLDGILTDLKPIELVKSHAVFPWQKHSQYEFEIGSRNHMGDSLEASRLIIHPFNKVYLKDYTPKDINNVYHANNRTYTLTWSRPRNRLGLQSYTVYWCFPKRASSNECRESMHFQQVPPSQLNFTTERQNALEEHTLNLAVSANYETFNTGLHWTACTMDVNGDLVKMDPELVASTTSIKVHWSVERVCTSILDGFNLTYCEVADDVPAENATCLHPPITVVLEKYDKKYNVSDLKPFTMYKTSMYMFSRIKKGRSSDPQLVRTLEGAPSPPRQLKVFDITNTSASIKWMEPSQRNGKIRKYIIMLNNDKVDVNASTLEYHFDNLESFTSYKVYILAQTLENSDTSNDVHFTTAIGYPSPPGLAPSSNNNSIIQWSKPAKPHGRLEFYEVAVTQMRNEEVLRHRINLILGGDTSCVFMKVPTCIGAEYQTTVEVRAVNAALLTHEIPDDVLYQNSQEFNDNFGAHTDESDDLLCEGDGQTKNDEEIKRYFNTSKYRLYKSPWQTSAIYSCSTSRMSRITTIALVVVAMSLGVMAALYMARKKYNKMANINCTLPAGLETYFTKDGNGFPGDFDGNGTHPKAFESATRTAEDQWISAARMHEFNFRNEHHHLLASLGNDSGYLGGGGGIDAVNGQILSSSLETANAADNCCGESRDNVDDEEYEKVNFKTSNMSSSADSLVESTGESESGTHSDVEQTPLSIFPNDNGYIKQSMLQPWQNLNERNVDENNQPPGYIQSLDVANTLPPPVPQTSGYVLQQDLHNFFNNTLAQQPAPTATINENIPQFSSGYTTLDELSKLNVSSPLSASAQLQHRNNQPPQEITTNFPEDSAPPNSGSIIKASAAGGGISGYVTQHDLNLFAHHQQH